MIVVLCILYGVVGWVIGHADGWRWCLGMGALFTIIWLESAYANRRVRQARVDGAEAVVRQIRTRSRWWR